MASTAQTGQREAARLRLMAARVVAVKKWPYLANLLFSLRLVGLPDEQLDTMAVDAKWRLYYSSTFVLEVTTEELATVLIHEAMHCLMSHSRRFREVLSAGGASVSNPSHKQLVWNIAADCGINHILDEQRVPFPQFMPGVRFSDFANADMGTDKSTEANYLALLTEALDNEGDHDCGSATGGARREYEIADDDATAPAAGAAEQERVIDRVASDIKAAQHSGKVPLGLARWADAHLDPRIDWRKQLATKVRAAVANVAGRRDYTYQRPARRQGALYALGTTAVLPAMRQPAPPRVAVVADTSGSISGSELESYIGELHGIIRAVGLSHGLTVIPCDTEAYQPVPVRRRATISNLDFHGGGGTDMRAGIDAALELRPAPHIVVVLTDGCTPWHASNPNQAVHYICMLTIPDQLHEVPPWMTPVLLPKG